MPPKPKQNTVAELAIAIAEYHVASCESAIEYHHREALFARERLPYLKARLEAAKKAAQKQEPTDAE